jgi:4-amino-4-deoxy-L-arabinose transferase-like glycosyltransferase
LTGSPGLDSGWLLPAALFAGVSGLLGRRRRPRGDPPRAAIVLWGTWLVVFVVVLSVTSDMNPYYTADLSPAIAALIGVGVALLWSARRRPTAWAIVAVTVAGSTAYAAWLIPVTGTGMPGWLRSTVIVVGTAATVGASIVALLVLRFHLHTRSARHPFSVEMGTAVGLLGALAAVTLVPAVASASIVSGGEGMYNTPFEPPIVTELIHLMFVTPEVTAKASLPNLERARHGAPDLLATQTSAVASVFVYASGQEALPIGGFTGTIPVPTLRELRSDVAAGQFHLVVDGQSDDPRVEWIADRCFDVGRASGSLTTYYCVPADAR